MSSRTPFRFSVPTEVRFGEGASAQLADILPKGVANAAVVRGRRGLAAAPVVAELGAMDIKVHEVACLSEPSVASINEAVAQLRGKGIDLVVACGGGAAIDSGKAIGFCLSHDLTLGDDFSEVPSELLGRPSPIPCVAIPTTAGTGAEVTANAVLDVPSKQAKVSLRGRALIPAIALVDPLLLPSAPAQTVLSSGLDAVVQTLEAYTSSSATPFSDALTAPNILKGLEALKAVVETGSPEAWRTLAWVSHTSGLALANGGLGAAHGLASVVGGRYGAPHGALCGRFLVPVLRQNLKAAESTTEAARRIIECRSAIQQAFPPLNPENPFSGLEAWTDAHVLPRLAVYGVERAHFVGLAAQSAAASSSKKNAVELVPADFVEILEASL